MNDTQVRAEELPVIVIEQGRANPKYFHIIQPVPGREFTVGQRVDCINPKSKEILHGVVTEHFWTLDWNVPPVGFLLEIWSVEPKILRKVLLSTDPEFKDDWFRVILIKEC